MSEPDQHAFDPDFLGVRAPLPTAPADAPLRELTYTHFTVLLDPRRRLAAATGVNVDGASLLDVGRGDDWHLDPRVGADEQAGPELYARNDLDRGHLVRRRDPVWGTPAVAGRANVDTFAYPNAAPQAAEFNQSKALWNGLEDYLLEHARVHRLRLTVLTGTVLDPDDPVYRGIGIPRLFWKVAAWADVPDDADPGTALRLATTAYVLDQTPQLDEIALRAATAQALAAGDAPPLGPFRTFQVPVRDVEELTRLDLGPLVAADRLAAVAAQDDAPAERSGWVPLASARDVRL
ncbi:DNA/RNA non-specific endonuclease [Cellulomonas sp. NS3]|uniref:DNA/RNA non-specific endonuclease n=1 Tax=Cellulomonas sp. NS3 TaxID=2973977 RepID=UPI002162C0D3|nr:DNA/RNA non-specific endonuclease [Cellulomonas sp. NS3]